MGQHESWTAGLGDDVGHRERRGTRRPQQRLSSAAGVHPVNIANRRGLVALRAIGRREVVGGHGCCGPNAPSSPGARWALQPPDRDPNPAVPMPPAPGLRARLGLIYA